MYLDLDINNSVDSTWNWGTAPMITLNDKRVLNLRKVWSFLDDSASAGDFILKEKGSLQFILEKPNGKTYRGELDFVCDE